MAKEGRDFVLWMRDGRLFRIAVSPSVYHWCLFGPLFTQELSLGLSLA